MFYANNGRIAGRNLIWVQDTLTTLARMFQRVGLYKNLGNTKALACNPVFIWVQMGKYTYKRQATGEGTTFWEHN